MRLLAPTGVQVRVVHGTADLALVAVRGCGVDVVVPGAECRFDGGAVLVRWCLEHPEPQRGHVDAVVEGDGFPWCSALGGCGGENRIGLSRAVVSGVD